MKQFNKVILVVMLAVLTLSVKAQDKLIQFNELPKTAQNFVTKYYDAKQVSFVVIDKELFSTSYKVKLTNGIEVEFDGKGNWKEVDAGVNAVPHQIVDANIVAYVKRSFPNNKIVQISREKNKIEVELSNGLDLVFNKNGKFIRIDD